MGSLVFPVRKPKAVDLDSDAQRGRVTAGPGHVLEQPGNWHLRSWAVRHIPVWMILLDAVVSWFSLWQESHACVPGVVTYSI